MLKIALVVVLLAASAAAQTVTSPSDIAAALGAANGIDINFLTHYPKIFGIDILGWGCNVRDGLPEDTLTGPLFDFTLPNQVPANQLSSINTYVYPLNPNQTFRVPAGLYVRTVADAFGTNHVYENATDYVTTLNLNLGLGINYQAKASNNSNHNPSGSPSGGPPPSSSLTNSSLGTSPSDAHLGSFSGNLNVNYVHQKLSQGSFYWIENTLTAGLWQTVIGPDKSPSARILQILNQTVALGAKNPTEYLYFIEQFGTHYIESIVSGGTLGMHSMTQKLNTTNKDQLSVLANAQFQNMFGLQQLSVNFDFEYLNKLEVYDRITNSQMTTCGGDPSTASFFTGNTDPGDTFQQWMQNLPNNPGAVRLRLRPTCRLFMDYFTMQDWDTCNKQLTVFMGMTPVTPSGPVLS